MKQILNPRGTTATNDGFTGPASLLTVDTERWELRLHDNETPGGHRILNLAQLIEIFMSKQSEFGAVAFAPNDRGFLVRVGHKVWTLRSFEAGDGIEITNPIGQEGNPVISLDADFLDDLFLQKIAGRLLTATTTGEFTLDEDDNPTTEVLAFEIVTPTDDPETADKVEGWIHNVDGACVVLKFHENAADSATLSVNEAAAIPLKTANNSTRVSAVAKKNSIALAVYFGGSYYLIGLQHPQEQGIIPIEGLVATNVQDALEELAQTDPPITNSGFDGYYVFGSMSSVPTGFKLSDVLTEAGKCIMVRKPGVPATSTGAVTTPGRPPEVYYVVRLASGYWMGRVFTGLSYGMDTTALIVTDVTMPDYNSSAMYGPPSQMFAISEDAPTDGALTITSGWGGFQKTAAKP